MKAKSSALLAASVLTTLLASGCAEEQEALIFLHAPAWPSDYSCGVDPASDIYLPRGKLDVMFSGGYQMPGVLLNNLVPTSPTDNANGVENNEIQLVDAEVRLEMPQDPDIIDSIEAQSTALVEFVQSYPSNSVGPGERHAVLIEAIPAPTAAALRDSIVAGYCGGDPQTCGNNFSIEVLAGVVFNAKRHASSGKRSLIHSREFTFPIDLCYGCLIDCSSCDGGQCPSGTTSWVGGVCDVAQDNWVTPAACAQEDA